MPLTLLDTTDDHALPVRVLLLDETPLARWTPVHAYGYNRVRFHPDAEYVLSRFAYLRREHDLYVLEVAEGAVRIDFLDRQALVLFAQVIAGVDVDVTFMEFLVTAGMMDTVEALAPASADDLAFHDALFQWKTRTGGNGLLPVRQPFLPAHVPPAIKPPMSTTLIPLFTPDIDALQQSDLPFTRVLEARRTRYDYGEPLTLAQLGEFLYRSARVQQELQGAVYTGTLRPSPGAGALHALELYIVAVNCAGLTPDVYHYDPAGHVLESLHVAVSFEPLVENALRMTGGRVETPQALIIIAARFDRICWKYPEMALSLILKDVGALYQTMYLVATAMGLAPCALGGGDSRLFSRIVELEAAQEQSVAEFLLGNAIRTS